MMEKINKPIPKTSKPTPKAMIPGFFGSKLEPIIMAIKPPKSKSKNPTIDKANKPLPKDSLFCKALIWLSKV